MIFNKVSITVETRSMTAVVVITILFIIFTVVLTVVGLVIVTFLFIIVTVLLTIVPLSVITV